MVIADDFTGAMDTGVQFQAKGTLVQIGKCANQNFFPAKDHNVQVLIIDAETRHMSPEDAYRTVSYIVSRAVEAGVACIYKKTDSALRGNIGSELTAMLQASGKKRIHFIPAFPKVDRTTVNGVHYINGVPVAKSVFGSDPFEPVCHSSVGEIIAEQSDTEVHLISAQTPSDLPDGILVYDAASDSELSAIADRLKHSGHLQLLAGCAGFAAALPELLELEQNSGALPVFQPRLLTICGSINPITVSQLDAAERHGAVRIRLTPEQKLSPNWLDSPQGEGYVTRWLSQIKNRNSAILDCSGVQDENETHACAARLNLDLPAMRQRISDTMGAVLKRLLDLGLESTLLVTGGDTLLAFLRQINLEKLVPIRELMPGVVISQVRYRGKSYNLISKSGGFGEESLLADLEKMITGYKEELLC